MRPVASGALALALVLAAPPARAQRWVTSGVSDVASGVEGGGGRAYATARAGTRIRVGADLAVDESPEDVFGGGVIVSLEPRPSFGVDGRYTRLVRRWFALTGGVSAYLQPGTLVGPLAGFEVRIPLARSFVFALGPEANIYVFGTDLPDT